ncbi:ESPR-type extended signal peptide-containing protein [Megasphaera elsdenii]|uniref:ESPR-type extended signal peptide-containing protein n=1 Tax=Megasphaera elsdenii TaxID=907 RepID=UPI00243270AC|nr:ESPR-type extended signal peptide-containing protein [Megasphaera elsdenii]
MNKTYKVIYNRTRCMYQVVSELAKGHTKSETPEMLKSLFNKHSGLTRGIVMAVLSMSLAMPVGVAVQAADTGTSATSGDTPTSGTTGATTPNESVTVIDGATLAGSGAATVSSTTSDNKNIITISVPTNGTVEKDNTGLVTGGTVYTAVSAEQAAREAADTTLTNKIGTLDANGNYIQKDASVSSNLSTLDTKVKANADAVSKNTTDITNLKNLSNINTDGETVIRKQAKQAVQVAASGNATVSTSGLEEDGSTLTYTINVANDGTISVGDTNLVSGGTMYTELRPTGGTYVLAGNTTAANLLALDTNLVNVVNALGLDVNDTTKSYTSKLNKYFKVNPKITTSTDGTTTTTTYAPDAAANGTNAVAIGPSAQVGESTTDATTSTTTVTGGTSSTAVGDSAKANGNQAVALGYSASVLNPSSGTSTGSTAIGSNATVDSASNAMALGTKATINETATNGLAIGNGAVTGSAKTTATKADNTTVEVAAAGGVNSVAIGTGATNAGNTSIALGDGASVTNDTDGNYQAVVKSDDIAIGTSAKTSASDSSTAIGKSASVSQSTDAVAIGSSATASSSNDALVLGKEAKAASAADSIAMGTSAAANSADVVAIGSSTSATGANSVVIGKSAQTTSEGGNAIGSSSTASGRSTAIGQSATANNFDALAIGNGATANADRSISLGYHAGVGTTEGKGETQTSGSLIAIGTEAGNNVAGMQNIAIGSSAGSDTKSNYNVAIGSSAGYNITYSDDSNNQNGYNVSIGYKANYQDTAANIMNAISIGEKTNAGNYAVAIGGEAQATGTNSIALGYKATAADTDSMALGYNSSAANGNIAIGVGSTAPKITMSTAYLTGDAAPSTYISVGTSDNLRRISNVADGSAAQDVVTVHQLTTAYTDLENTIKGIDTTSLNTYSTTAIDSKIADVKSQIANAKTKYFSYSTSTSTLAANADNTGATATAADAMAIGPNANATNTKTLAIGNNVYATGLRSIAIGTADNPTTDSAGTKTTHNTSAEGENSIALGTSTTAQSDNSVAIGTRAQTYTTDTTKGSITGVKAVAIGYSATTAGDTSVAVGNNATVKYASGTAVGTDSLADGTNAVAIGEGSKAYSDNSTAIGQGNSITGNNTYGLGSSNTVSGAWGSVTTSGVSGYNNSVTSVSDANTMNAISGIYITGNSNSLTQNVVNNVVSDITAMGSSNTIDAGAGGTSSHPNTLSQIAIVGSGNTVQGKSSDDSKTNNIKDVTILGYNNKVDANTDTTVDFSNTQILGSNVTAKLGNSVYLGSNAAYIGQTPAASDAITSARTAADAAAEASDAYKAATTDTEKAQIKAQYEAQYLYQLNVQAMEAKGTTAGTQSYSTDETYGDGTSYTYAGSSPAGVVTVGSVGAERRIQNVAAGLVSATSTDAVNGSQLYALTRQLRFGGDNSSFGTTTADDNNVVARGSNETLAIIGGADTSTLTDNNIGVISDGKDTLTVKLNKNVDLGTDGSVVAGNTTLSNNGLTIADGPKLTSSGISAGSQQINNVTAGTSDTDAVNYGQMKNARTLLTKGTNTTLVDSVNGDQHTYTVNVDDLAVKVNSSQKSVHLKDGLVFGNGTNTTATMSDDGTITYNISDATIKTRAKDAINLTAGSNVTVDTITSADGTTKTFTVKATHNKLTSATAATGDQDNVTLTLKDADGNEVTSTGLKNTYSTGGSVTYAASGEGTATVTRNDGNSYIIKGLKDTKVSSGKADYTGATGTATLTMNDGTTATITGLQNDYVTTATVTSTGTNKNHVTLTRLGGGTVDVNLNPILDNYSLSDYQLVGNGDTQDQAYTVGSDGTVTLNVVDSKNAANKKTIQITGLASQSGVTAGRTTVQSSDNSVKVTDSTANGDTHTYDIQVDYAKIPANLKVQYSGDNGTTGSNTMDTATAFNGTAGQIEAIAENGKVTFKLANDITGINSVTTGNAKLDTNGLTITGGPSVTTSGIDAGSKRITGVANGENASDAVNKGQLDALQTQVNSASFNVKADNSSGAVQAVKAGDTVTFANDSNLTLVQGEKTFTYGLNKEINISKVTTSDPTKGSTVQTAEGVTTKDAANNVYQQNASGITLTPGTLQTGKTAVKLTNTGLDNGGNAISNVAAGTKDMDAVNVSQLRDVEAKVGNGWQLTDADGKKVADIGAGKQVSFKSDNGYLTAAATTNGTTGATVTLNLKNKSLETASGKVKTVESGEDGLATAKNVAETINSTYWTAASGKTGTGTQEDKTTDASAKQISSGGTVTFNAGNNLALVQNGSAFTYGLQSNLTDMDTISFTARNDADGNPVRLIIGKQANANGTTDGYFITGLDNTTWNQSNYVGNRAATEAQLASAIKQVTLASQSGGFKLSDDKNKEVSQVLGQAIGVVGDGNVTTAAETTTTDTNGHIKVSLNKDIDLTNQGSVTVGQSKLTNGQATIGGVTVNGTEKTVTGLSNTTWEAAKATVDASAGGYQGSTKAATESQLAQAISTATTTAAQNEQHIKAGTYEIGQSTTDKDGNDIGKNSVAINVVSGEGANEQVKGQVIIKDVAKASDVGDTAKLADDIKNKNGNATSVVDAVNNLNGKVGDNQYLAVTGKEIQNGDSSTTAIGKLNNRMNDIYSKATQHSTVTRADDNVTIQTSTNADGGTNYQIGLNKEKIDLGKVTIQGNEGSITAKSMTADTFMAGNTVVSNDGVKIGDKSALTSDTLKVNGKTYVSGDGLNANSQKITNVADGSADTDAVNVKQVNDLAARQGEAITENAAHIGELGRAVNKLGNRLNRVGAGAAALAALHPGTYDPNDKWDFSAGIGHYHDANAVAIGAYYHPNDTTILSIGGSMGGGENMVNAGITWKMGRSSHESAPVVVRKAAAAPVVQPSAPVRLAPVIAPAPVTAPVPAKTVVPSTPVSTAPAVTTTAMTAAPSGDTAALTQILARQTAILEKLAQNQSQAARPTAVAHGDDIFPDVPENHWAYAYVAKLEKAGALKGFKRPAVLKSPMMTRDDFASVLYTAMANGATTNPALNGDDSLNRLAQEFKAELKDVKP